VQGNSRPIDCDHVFLQIYSFDRSLVEFVS